MDRLASVVADEILHAPDFVRHDRGHVSLLLDPAGPHWLAVDARGAFVADSFRDGASPARVAESYAAAFRVNSVDARWDVAAFGSRALTAGFFSRDRVAHPREAGRAGAVEPERLAELWLHVDNRCNLTCVHCLVDSGPDGERGLATAEWLAVITDARALGARRFLITGGEPFLRRDLPEILQHACADGGESVVLTNGMLLPREKLVALRALERVRLQISLDGATPATNDALRGKNCFAEATECARAAVALGLDVTVSTAIMPTNLAEVAAVTKLLPAMGVRAHHLLWPHDRGRAREHRLAVTAGDVLRITREARDAAREAGVVLDNFAHLKARLAGPKLLRYDHSNAGVESLCVYADGGVFPSAAFAGHAGLRMGSVRAGGLERAWRASESGADLRSASLVDKERCATCDVRYLCGGGDVEHTYFHGNRAPGRDAFLGADPYCDAHFALVLDALDELARESADDSGLGLPSPRPVILRAMGDGAAICAKGVPYAVLPTRSACVLPAPRRER